MFSPKKIATRFESRLIDSDSQQALALSNVISVTMWWGTS